MASMLLAGRVHAVVWCVAALMPFSTTLTDFLPDLLARLPCVLNLLIITFRALMTTDVLNEIGDVRSPHTGNLTNF